MTALSQHLQSRVVDMPAAADCVWGLDTVQLHDRFWAARGVQVVRPTGPRMDPDNPQVYALVDDSDLFLTDLPAAIRQLPGTHRTAIRLTMHERAEQDYTERVDTTDTDQLVAVRRDYSGRTGRVVTMTLTADPHVATAWQRSAGGREGLRDVRAIVPLNCYDVRSCTGRVFDSNCAVEARRCRRTLLASWDDVHHWIRTVRQHSPNVWTHRSSRIEDGVKFIGRAWIGAGRHLRRGQLVVGPWTGDDHREATPPPVRWGPLRTQDKPTNTNESAGRLGTRAFDITFSVIALLVSAPLFPLIMLMIWLQDGRPFFFAHPRQSQGGREFNCYKFRTMIRNAEVLKDTLADQDNADGPQVNIPNDPRLSRSGRMLRRFHLDELPQFWNVLRGHMSVVGPRPSPDNENQYCPAWREARLSVKPGVTGLWQISRTRKPDLDFQEWIRYDLEYVRRRNWRMDLRILFATLKSIVRGR